MRDLARLWPAMDWAELDRSFPAWATAVGGLVTTYRSLSANVAAGYLRSARYAAGITGTAPIVLASAVPAAQLETALATTAVWGAKAAAARGVLAEQAMADAFVRSSGAATRLVLAGGRETIAETAKADPRASRMRRVTSANPCDFCTELADFAEGNDALNTDFQAHDHCGCSAEVEFA